MTPDSPSESSRNWRKWIETRCVEYFESIELRYPSIKWRLGRETALRWAVLVDADPVPPEEVMCLIADVDACKYFGSAWYDMAIMCHGWVKSVGCPPPYDFHHWEKTYGDGGTYLLVPEFYIEYFDTFDRLLPEKEMYRIGRDTALRWQALRNSDPVPMEEAINLITAVDKYKQTSNTGFALALGISRWASSIGCPLPYDCWPDPETD